MADIYGQLVKAQFENLASDPGSVAGMVYYNTGNNTVKFYDGTAYRTLVDTATAQTLALKTLTSPQINSGVLLTPNIDDYADFNEESAPATPSAGKLRVYAKTDKKLYTKDSAGTEAPVGASGSGELNLIDNPSDSNNWSVTGAGWSGALSTTTTAGDLPLAGIVDTAIKITSDTSAGAETAEYVSYAFTTPASLASKLKVEFYMRPGANFIASEWTVSVYATSTRQALSTDVSAVTYLPNVTGKFTTTFDCAASTAYTVRFARPVNAGGNAGILNVANVIVGPGIQPQGAAVGDWQAYTPTGAWNTNVTYTGRWRRVGTSMEVEASVACTGAPNSAGLYFALPTGYTLDTTKISAATNTTGSTAFGYGLALDVGTRVYPLIVTQSGTSTTLVTCYSAETTGATASGVEEDSPFTFGNGDCVRVHFSVPIAEWSGGGTVNVVQNELMYVSNDGTGGTTANTDYSTGMQTGQTGSQFASVASTTANAATSYLVNWPYPINQSSVKLQVSRDAGVTWVDGGGDISISGRLDQGTSIYGMYYTPVSATSGKVFFGNKGRLSNNATYAGDGAAWSGIAGSSSFKWRAVGAAAGQAIGFGEVGQTTSGLVKSAGQLKGTNTNDSAAAGYVGETQFIQLSEATPNSLVNDNEENLMAAISLTPGMWRISGAVAFVPAATTNVTQILAAVNTTSGTIPGSGTLGQPSSTGQIKVIRSSAAYVPGDALDLVIPSYTVKVSATTSYYLVVRSKFTVSTMTAAGFLEAVRIR